MALSLSTLEDGLVEAFEKGQETEDAPGGEDGEKKSKHSEGNVAGMIADAIVAYAKDAEVTVYAPMLFITPPTPPVGIMGTPNPATIMMKMKPAAADAAKPALKSAAQASFAAGDPAMSPLTAGIIAYAATLAAWMSSTGLAQAGGATIMSVPPIFAPCIAAGLAGADQASIAKMMAGIIHASFMATMFTGAGADTAPPSAGPVISTLT